VEDVEYENDKIMKKIKEYEGGGESEEKYILFLLNLRRLFSNEDYIAVNKRVRSE
jgi:hypothetical protein